MKNRELSIAIPFYNGFETIVAILQELGGNIDLNYEIIISDDCSDLKQSESLIQYLESNFSRSNILYSRNEKNLGMDLNFQKCIELSNAEYTWFLGQDDFIQKSSLSKAIKYIKQFNPNVTYLNYEIVRTWNFKKNFIHTDNRSIISGNDLRHFIKTTKGNVPHFLPSLIVKTDLWPNFKDLEYLAGSYFIQLGAFLQILATHKKWLYIGEPMSVGVIPNDGWQSSVEKKVRIYHGFMFCILNTYKKYPQLVYLFKQQYYKNYYQHFALSIESKLENNSLLLSLLKSKQTFTKSFILVTILVEITPFFFIASIFYCKKKISLL